MHHIAPEIAARDIAKICCKQKYDEISRHALNEWKATRNGDPDVMLAKKMWELYSTVYDSVFDAAREFDNFLMEE